MFKAIYKKTDTFRSNLRHYRLLGRAVYLDTAHHSISRYRTPICNGNRPIHWG